MDGYGRTISRPHLDLRRRELCSIAMLVAQGVPRQLHSHLQGALNAGATPAEIEEVLNIVKPDVSEMQSQATGTLWQGMRK